MCCEFYDISNITIVAASQIRNLVIWLCEYVRFPEKMHKKIPRELKFYVLAWKRS